MSYVESDGVRYWVDDRRPQSHQDPRDRAAEILARDVERFLYRDVNPDGSPNPAYRNQDFLAWTLARYDACKTGSGQGYTELDWDPESGYTHRPIPEPSDRVSSASYYDHTITARPTEG